MDMGIFTVNWTSGKKGYLFGMDLLFRDFFIYHFAMLQYRQ